MTDPLPIDLPPAEAVEFFREKGFRPSFAWQDMMHAQHAIDFTVAKMLDTDLLRDVHASLQTAIEDGQSYRQWAEAVEPELRRRGWWGRQRQTDPLTGETRLVQLGSDRRMRIIYDANMRSAMAAGRWRRIERLAPRRPYLRYIAVLDERTRPDHAAWHGTILPWDHPWWEHHVPPNGWRCRCTVVQLSERDLERHGWQVSPNPAVQTRRWTNRRTGEARDVPVGVDPGWDYHVGRADHGARMARLLLERTTDLPPQLGATVEPFLDHVLPRLADDYRAWLDTVDRERPRGERRVVGLLSRVVVEGLAQRGITPQNAAISIADRTVAHMLRDHKEARGTALPMAALRRLPEALANPRAVLWDRQSRAVIYVWTVPSDTRSGTAAVRVDFGEKSRDADGERRFALTNAIRSAGLVDPTSLGPGQYEVIDGAL